MSNCPKCGLLIGQGTMSTTLPLCQCQWKDYEHNAVLAPTDALIKMYADAKVELAAEQEARKKAEADCLLWKTMAENYCDMHKEQKQRAEAAEALIKASREREEELRRENEELKAFNDYETNRNKVLLREVESLKNKLKGWNI